MNTLSSILKFIAQGGLWSLTYPVGSYYETSDANFNPNTAWGGTWVLEAAGKVHIGAGTGYTIGATGGATTVTLSTAQIPAHTHNSRTLTGAIGGRKNGEALGVNIFASGNICSDIVLGGQSFTSATSSLQVGSYHPNGVTINATHTHDSVGGGQAHNNMQPYIVVNRWHRTA